MTTNEATKVYNAASDPKHLEWMRGVAGIPESVPVEALGRFLGLALVGHGPDGAGSRVYVRGLGTGTLKEAFEDGSSGIQLDGCPEDSESDRNVLVPAADWWPTS